MKELAHVGKLHGQAAVMKAGGFSPGKTSHILRSLKMQSAALDKVDSTAGIHLFTYLPKSPNTEF